MRFERIHTTTTYLLVSTGFAVLFLSGELSPLFWALTVPLLVGSAIRRVHIGLSNVSFWNAVLVLALLGFSLLAYLSGDWLLYAIYFCSLMVVAKLYQRRNARDYFQLYAVSFMQLIVAAVINPTISFGLCFLLYVIFLTWALVLLHLRRDMEQLMAHEGEESGSVEARFAQAGRLIRPGFLVGSSVLALAIFACSIVVFLFFPRLGLGLFGQHQKRGPTVSGFSDSIELGGFGISKLDQTTILRVELNNVDPRGALPLRLKGISFDHYDGQRWSKSQRPMTALNYQEAGFWKAQDTDPPPSQAELLSMKIYTEHMQIDRKTVFADGRIRGVRDMLNSRFVPHRKYRTRFYQDSDLDVLYTNGRGSPLRYEVESYRVAPNASVLRASDEMVPRPMQRYLQLPPLDARVVQLAHRVTNGKATTYDKVVALEQHLMNEYTYSLDGGHNPDDPLLDFLFGQQSGHCEYFSTALTILLRALGIPARSVGGFYGGKYNDVGQYVQVRQADAHSWTEVYFSGVGWVPFDATPPGGALATDGDGFFAEIGLFFDAMELAWHKWVIRWNLERQIDMLRGLRDSFGEMGSFFSSSGEKTRTNRMKMSLRDNPEWVLGGVVVVLLLILWWTRRGRRRHRSGRSDDRRKGRLPGGRDRSARAMRSVYQKLLQGMARRGLTLTPGMTPRRLLTQIVGRSPEARGDAARIVDLYEQVVFGGQPLAASDKREAKRALGRLKKVSRGWKKAA